MKYFQYSQYLYLIAGTAFLISAIYKYTNKEDNTIQLIIGVGFIVMYFVRKSFIKRMNNKS